MTCSSRDLVLVACWLFWCASFVSSVDHDMCGFGDIKDSTGGTISLSVGESDSSEKLQCSRVIRVKTGRVALNITELSVSNGDVFEIRDGPYASAQKLGNSSANIHPAVYEASGNAIFLQFRRKDGLKVTSSHFRAGIYSVRYPNNTCLCREVAKGSLDCEENYQKRVCHVTCEENHYDVSLGSPATCDMQKGKWNIDSRDRVLSCQRVSAPLGIEMRLVYSYLNGSCQHFNSTAVKEVLKNFLASDAGIESIGRCFTTRKSNCTVIEPVEVKCEDSSSPMTVNVTLTDEITQQGNLKPGSVEFKKLYEAYKKIDFKDVQSGKLNVVLANYTVIANVSSLQSKDLAPVCPDDLVFIHFLETAKTNLSQVCSACPINHFYDPKGLRCEVCNKEGAGAGGASSCTAKNGSTNMAPSKRCENRCMLGKQLGSDGFCEWCPFDQYQNSTQRLNPTCYPCPSETKTPFTGAFNESQCFKPCSNGTYLNTTNGQCHECPIGSYQSRGSHVLMQCHRCGDGKRTAAVGSSSEADCFGPCMQGSYLDVPGKSCAECPLHSFQDGVNQVKCKNCTDGKMTIKPGAKNESSCIVPCEAGQFLKMENGKVSCEACVEGSYQEERKHLKTNCKPCGQGKITKNAGAKNVSECIVNCPAGHFSDNKQCRKCPRGSYQDLANQMSCKHCPGKMTTETPGQTSQSACMHMCSAGSFFNIITKNCSVCPFGTYQDAVNHVHESCKACPSNETSVAKGAVSLYSCTNVDSNCTAFPCQNGAACSQKENGVRCHCRDGVHGDLCEVLENKDELRRVTMSLQFSSLKWTKDLEDHESHTYHHTKGRIEAAIGEEFNNDPSFKTVDVTDLRNGSIVAEFDLHFSEKSDPIPGKNLQIAAAHGDVGNLPVTSLKILQQTCNAALGMETGNIKDCQISSSTTHPTSQSQDGRLNKKGTGWHAKYEDKKEFLQIDFLQSVNITAVATQGMSHEGKHCFVTEYKLSFSDDSKTWDDYREQRNVRVCLQDQVEWQHMPLGFFSGLYRPIRNMAATN